MKAYKLRLEKDCEIPRFKRLAFRDAEVSIVEILTKGIHPVGRTSDYSDSSGIDQKMMDVLNDDRFKINGLAEFGYCGSISPCSTTYYYEAKETVHRNLEHIHECIRFVDSLDFAELLNIAKRRLREGWDHKMAKKLLASLFYQFNDQRAFLKGKDPGIKLSGYQDLDAYDLGRVVSLDDFAAEEKLLIGHGIDLTNFRSELFIKEITTEEGYLSLVPGINDFTATVRGIVHYNCTRKGDIVTFVPTLDDSESTRNLAKFFAAGWRIDSGCYVFKTDLERLDKMVKEDGCSVNFPRLSYTTEKPKGVSTGKLETTTIPKFRIGSFRNHRSTNDELKSILKAYGIPQTGKKEDLLGKLIDLAAREYKKQEKELSRFFGSKKFIRVPSGSGGESFPALEGVVLRNLLMSMYAMRHMRGSTILEASHENTAYQIKDLARAMVMEDIRLEGCFVRVE